MSSKLCSNNFLKKVFHQKPVDRIEMQPIKKGDSFSLLFKQKIFKTKKSLNSQSKCDGPSAFFLVSVEQALLYGITVSIVQVLSNLS